MPVPRKLGIIAGGGNAPRRMIDLCKQAGIDVFVVCLEGQAEPDLAKDVPHAWLPLGAAAQLKELGNQYQVDALVLIGKVRRPSLSAIKPDWLAMKIIAKIGFGALGDDGLLQAVTKAIEEEGGVKVIGIHEVFADFLMPSGLLGKHEPSAQSKDDIRHGLKIASELGKLDIGQSVIVQQGIVLGVEAIEGTDELMRRAGQLRREGAGGVLVKICKPGQDRRFDLPTIGPETIRMAAASGLSGIAVEAGASLLIDRDETARLADEAGLFLLGFLPQDWS
jgi:DUF1009 family protein